MTESLKILSIFVVRKCMIASILGNEVSKGTPERMKKTAFKRHLRMLGILASLWVCSIANGQIYKYIGLSDGLSSRNVYAVQQSNNGFMWFLTDNGIDRYDGKSISTYSINLAGHRLSEYSSCQLIHDQKEDNLWVVTRLGHIVKYDKRSNSFKMMYSPQIIGDMTDVPECSASPIDINDNIWMFVGKEAFRYNVRLNERKTLNVASDNEIKSEFSAVITKDSTTLFVGTKKSIYIGIIKEDSLLLESIPALKDANINVNTLYYNEKFHTLLIGTEDKGIIAYKEKNQQVIHNKGTLPDVRVTKILPYKYGNEVIFSTNAACVFRMNMEECIPKSYLQADFTTDYKMNSDNVADMCIDEDGQLWMCTFPKGLTIYNDQYPEFNWQKRSLLYNNTLIDNGIDCILEDSQHDIWYATDNGISLHNVKTDKWTTMLSLSSKSPNPNHYFLSICEVKPGIILVGGYASGIYIINKHTRETRFIRPKLLTPEKYIQTMYKDPSDGTIWMGGENQLFNISYNGDIKVNHAEVFGGINHITERDENSLWIGTKDGLYVFDKETHRKRRIEFPIQWLKVNTVFQDSDGTIYIGTQHDGLIVYNEEENYYKRYDTTNSALTNNCMKSIVCANNGSLFISSDDGIVRFNKNTKKITTWTSDQGLEGINFSTHSGICTHRNTIMFGGDCGVIEIHESVSLPHIYKANLILTDLHIGNRRINPEDKDSPITNAIDDTKFLVLSHSERNAAIKVKNINHLYPSDCIISWTTDRKLDEAQWNRLNEDGFIILNGLKVGRHLLTIRSISKESNMILDEHALTVTIKPPFYFSLPGLIIEIGLLVLAFILTLKYNKSTNAMHISDEKVKFFINTAHDLRTTLTLIKAPLEELKENTMLTDKDKASVDIALRNTNNLVDMANNAMKYEIESIEKKVLRIECHDAIEYFNTQINRWSNLAQIKQQQIEYEYPNEPFNIWVDTRKLNSIIQNLISNAIKYNNEHGTIKVILYKDTHTWGFHVIDQGIGINDTEQRKLFKQHFRGTNAINAKVMGSGIGLLSITRYIKAMKGIIDVSSQINNGSDFHIQFPLGYKHYDKQSTLFVETPDKDQASMTSEINEQETSEDLDNRTRILIVEDNPDLLNYLGRIFREEYKVYTSTNGEEALMKVQHIQPALVLTDIMMPKMRGDELCIAIKNNIETSHIPVVIISALADQKHVINGLSVKVDAYITKPFEMKILQFTIRNIIENRKLLNNRQNSIEEFTFNITDTTTELELKFIAEMKEIINEHLDNQDFTIEILAYKLRISRTSLYNKVKLLTGYTPSDFIRECRINKAKKLLNEHRYTIAEITDQVGFADQKYFREVFKRATGMTPTEYANQNKK